MTASWWCAGASGGLMGAALRRVLAVAVASLMLQEKCKCSCPMGLLGEAIICQDQQVWLTGPTLLERHGCYAVTILHTYRTTCHVVWQH